MLYFRYCVKFDYEKNNQHNNKLGLTITCRIINTEISLFPAHNNKQITQVYDIQQSIQDTTYLQYLNNCTRVNAHVSLSMS